MKLKNSIVLKVIVVVIVGLSLVVIGTAVIYQYGLNKFALEQGQQQKKFGLEQEKEKLENQIHLCLQMIQSYYDRSQNGDSVVEMKKQALKQVAAMRLKDGNYFFIIDPQGRMLMHPIKPQLDGKDLSKFKDEKGKMLFQAMVDEVKQQQEGFVDYWWSKPGQQEPSPKLSFVKLFQPWGWIVGMGTYIDQLDVQMRQQSSALKSSLNKTRNHALLVSIAIATMIVCLLIWLFRLLIGKPLTRTLAMFKKVAEDGDLTKRLPADRRDELGALADGVNTFIENLQKMLRRMVRGFENLSREADSLDALAGQQAAGADQMAAKATGVATAAEEMNSNMSTVAAAMEQASTNVSTVASGTEEMTATIAEIAKNTGQAKNITDQAVAQGETVAGRIDELGQAAQEIGQVTETINAISSQTNLLALNATIEAARAGEAGKGFAVVANEIKDLAQQTAAATGEIAAKIKGIQDSTGATVTEINEIARINKEVDEIVTIISAAVEEQSATTKEIAENIAQTSEGIGEVNENVSQTTEVSGTIAQEIAEVNEAAGSMSNASAQVRQSAEELKQLSAELNGLMSRFKL
ncbi:MAG: HAMP domain-containing protein [Xanthomonadaceae bacterium]|nr:HAMP domain-containing protein [Xanthomonadaceae bacterium]